MMLIQELPATSLAKSALLQRHKHLHSGAVKVLGDNMETIYRAFGTRELLEDTLSGGFKLRHLHFAKVFSQKWPKSVSAEAYFEGPFAHISCIVTLLKRCILKFSWMYTMTFIWLIVFHFVFVYTGL